MPHSSLKFGRKLGKMFYSRLASELTVKLLRFVPINVNHFCASRSLSRQGVNNFAIAREIFGRWLNLQLLATYAGLAEYILVKEVERHLSIFSLRFRLAIVVT